jgi:DICT domain-containing protein
MNDLKTLSLFELISHNPSQRMVRFDTGVLAETLFEAMELQFETTVSALAQMSHTMEMQALDRQVSGGHIYVGFQRLSRFTPRVAERYLQMALAGNHVYVFGLPDMLSPVTHERLHYIALGVDDALSNEWFVVIDTPQYQASLSALDLVGFDQALDIHDRLFTGVQTQSEAVTRVLSEALSQALQSR